MRFFASAALIALLPLPLVLGATYLLTDNIVGKTFYSSFDWEAIADPTNGRVNYVNEPTSMLQNLTFASADTFILRTDFKTVLDPNGPGRNSVRIRSKKTYTTHVAIFNMRHMPQGCATWPAVWETDEANWPNGGEIDILEGVNDQPPDLISIHTSPGCTMPSSRTMTGTTTYLDCQTGANGNAGCGVKAPTALSYGPAFNKVGGGWYVIERSPTYMKVWFWSRRDTTVPSEVASPGQYVNPDTWGTPVAYFPDTSCDFPSHFDAHNIIINLTLCGDWAGATYGQTSCPSTCVDYVNNNPAAFSGAYFDFASVRVYGTTVPQTKRVADMHARSQRRSF